MEGLGSGEFVLEGQRKHKVPMDSLRCEMTFGMRCVGNNVSIDRICCRCCCVACNAVYASATAARSYADGEAARERGIEQ